MPRQARLDTPGTLHHVIVRGIEKRPIVKDDSDRADFVDRMGQVALVRHHGVSLTETARQMGVSTSAIGNLLKRRGGLVDVVKNVP